MQVSAECGISEPSHKAEGEMSSHFPVNLNEAHPLYVVDLLMNFSSDLHSTDFTETRNKQSPAEDHSS